MDIDTKSHPTAPKPSLAPEPPPAPEPPLMVVETRDDFLLAQYRSYFELILNGERQQLVTFLLFVAINISLFLAEAVLASSTSPRGAAFLSFGAIVASYGWLMVASQQLKIHEERYRILLEQGKRLLGAADKASPLRIEWNTIGNWKGADSVQSISAYRRAPRLSLLLHSAALVGSLVIVLVA